MSLATPSRRRLVSCLGAAAVAGMFPERRAAAQALEFNSPYNFVSVQKEGSLVTFGYVLNTDDQLSAVDLSNPAYQVLPYTRYYYAADLVKRSPRQVLVAGLGAGAFHRLFSLVHPESRLVTVEIDPMILSLAQEHADFRTGADNEVMIDDARIFLRKSREIYDWILLDAFNREAQIPAHLTTQEFFRILHNRLADDGVVLANMVQEGTRFFASYVSTIRTVFPSVVLLPVRDSTNVVVVAAKSLATPIQLRLETLGPSDHARYQDYGVDLPEIVGDAVYEGDYLPRLAGYGTILTDDFAPVESLDRETAPYIGPQQPG